MNRERGSRDTGNLDTRLEAILRADPGLMRLFHHARAAGLPDWRLVSGCLYQTVWNVLTNRPRGHGIRDYDLIYHDPADLSWEAEDAVTRRLDTVPPEALPFGPLQMRNQARVHLWFESRFGIACPPLRSADESLTLYPATAQAIGARLEPDGGFSVVAPFGLADLFALILRPNRALANRATYAAKAERIRILWPEVAVLPW